MRASVNRLAELRKARGLTLCQLSALSMIDVSALSRIEHGDRIGAERRRRIAAALRMPVEDVFPEVKP